MAEYNCIRNQTDADYFIEQANGLHDGYITSLQFINDGIETKNGYTSYDYSKRKLVMQILVTSQIGSPTVEMVFENIIEWQVCFGTSDIFGCLFGFDGNVITMTDGPSLEREILYQNTFIQATQVSWRILDKSNGS